MRRDAKWGISWGAHRCTQARTRLPQVPVGRLSAPRPVFVLLSKAASLIGHLALCVTNNPGAMTWCQVVVEGWFWCLEALYAAHAQSQSIISSEKLHASTIASTLHSHLLAGPADTCMYFYL